MTAFLQSNENPFHFYEDQVLVSYAQIEFPKCPSLFEEPQNFQFEVMYNPFTLIQHPNEFQDVKPQYIGRIDIQTEETKNKDCTKIEGIDSKLISSKIDLNQNTIQIPKKRLKSESDCNLDTLIIDKSSETAKQERNRLCAKKFRTKKKEYVKKLEAEIERLKKVIIGYKNQVDYYKNKEIKEFAPELNIQEVTMNNFKLEEIMKSRSKASQILNNYLVQFLERIQTQSRAGLEKRKELIKILTERIESLLLPDIEKYFLWSAESSQSIFDFKEGKKIQRICKKEISNSDCLNDIWNIVSLTKRKKEDLSRVKNHLLELKRRLLSSINRFIHEKEHLLSIAKEITEYVRTEVPSLTAK